MKTSNKVSIAAFLVLLNVSYAAQAASATPKVFFVSPKEGASIGQKTLVKFGVSGMTVKLAGTMDPATGHHHLIIDGGPIEKGKAVPADATHLHFGKGQTETTVELTPGKHTLTLQFADGAHVSYGDSMSATVHVTVK